MTKSIKKAKITGSTPSPYEMSRRFVMGFIISSFGMVLAAGIYLFYNSSLVFDTTAQILLSAFILIGALMGWWMIKTGEKHAGYGIIFGSLFGILLIILAVALVALLFVAHPATGRFL